MKEKKDQQNDLERFIESLTSSYTALVRGLQSGEISVEEAKSQIAKWKAMEDKLKAAIESKSQTLVQ